MLAVVSSAVNVSIQTPSQADFISFGVWSGQGSLGHEVDLFLIGLRTSMLFSMMTAPMCILPTGNKGSFSTLINTSFLLVVAFLLGGR